MANRIAPVALCAIAITCAIANAAAADRANTPASSAVADVYPGENFATTRAETSGWPVERLAAAKSWSQQIAPTAAVMIVQHGRVVAQWGDVARKSDLRSVRKSLLSALIGIAVEEHRIDLGATMQSLGIDDNPPSLRASEKTATVADLLKARSGIYHAALYETADMAHRRPARWSHAPGTFWYYNNWDFNALGTVYERAMGASIFDAFDARIARPIGMQDYQPGDGRYFKGSASEHAAYPIKMSARDLARFALLYLHGGRWMDHQLVPASWVRDSIQSYSSAYAERRTGLGYGYMWWIGFPSSDLGAPTVRVPTGTFFAWGAEGQYAFVIPAYDLVVVHRIDPDGRRDPHQRSTSIRQIALLWLILSAAGDDDVGPDVTLSHAAGERLVGDTLKASLAGNVLSYGEALDGGPYGWQIDAGGQLSEWAGSAHQPGRHGVWRIGDEGRFCVTLAQAKKEECYDVVAEQNALRFFGSDGLMHFDMKRE